VSVRPNRKALWPEGNDIVEYENGSQQSPPCSLALNVGVNCFADEVLQFLDVLCKQAQTACSQIHVCPARGLILDKCPQSVAVVLWSKLVIVSFFGSRRKQFVRYKCQNAPAGRAQTRLLAA